MMVVLSKATYTICWIQKCKFLTVLDNRDKTMPSIYHYVVRMQFTYTVFLLLVKVTCMSLK
jgi:hypothetical protein